jgi:hypothetical protein
LKKLYPTNREFKSINIDEKLKKIKAARDRIVQYIEEGLITDEQVRNKLTEINQKEARLKDEKELLIDSLKNIPTLVAIKAVSEQVSASSPLKKSLNET